MSDFDARMAQLRARFLENAAAERQQAALALRSGDLATLEQIAHGLSGRGGVFGFGKISAAAQQVEECAAGGASKDELGPLCRTLFAEIDQAVQEG